MSNRFIDEHALARAEFTLRRWSQQQTMRFTRYVGTFGTAAALTTLFLLWVLYRWLWQPVWFTRLSNRWVELFDLYEFGSTITLLLLWGLVIWRRYGKQQRLKNTARIRARSYVAPTVDALYRLSPKEFEQFSAGIFRRKGYRVMLRGQAGDQGVDLEIYTREEGKQAIVQCKRYRNTIGPEIVRELYGTLIHERVAHAFLVTTADISDSAREWARDKPLTLIDGQLLVQIAGELGMRLPAPAAVDLRDQLVTN